MHRFALLLIDLILIAAATVLALVLRDNLEVSLDRLVQVAPYLLLTIAAAGPVLLAAGLNRALWRFSSLADYLLIGLAAIATVLLAVALGFVLNRLEGVARALPILQALLMACALIGVRVITRLRHAARGRTQGLPLTVSDPTEAVLVVGLNAVTELFLRAVDEFAPGRIKVAGLLGRADRHRGRMLRRRPVLGLPEELEAVLNELEVHGVSVHRIVVTTPLAQLSAAAQAALLHIEKTSNIRLDLFSERVGFETSRATAPTDDRTLPDGHERTAARPDADIEALEVRPYFRWKRVIDASAAAVAIVFLAPIALLISLIVMLDAGHPAIFWQQRPGARGWPFRLYKFRTMAAAHDCEGRRLADAERLSAVGRFLRRTHLDELPQLYNILIGEMSFVGPRPLLPSDQSPDFAARLAIRPGLTGWAQIKGGRELSASDKAALDVWYVKNASLRMDLQILWGTVCMICSQERADRHAIRRAWGEIGDRMAARARPSPRRLARDVQPVLSKGSSGSYDGLGLAARWASPPLPQNSKLMLTGCSCRRARGRTPE